uniref:LysR family transcriptional regulator n=1 Tax=Marinobacterium profundum TaxID=1714300 RepID=UPI00082A4C48|nr:LysR family transcriptional regulator [Marinobacterium profundum]
MISPVLSESLRSIVYFVTVAKVGSFTAAADELGVSKSTLGKSIAKLEKHLTTKLLHRTTRKLSLTTEGESYLASCQLALETLQEAESALLSKHSRPSGRVRVDLPAAFGRLVAMPLLLEMADNNPDLRLIITFNDKVIDPMDAGFDLAFRFGPLSDTNELVARKLNDQKLVLCASPDYLSRYGAPKTIDDLKSHRCIMAWRGGSPLYWLLKSESGDDIRFNPGGFHQISDGDAMVDACVAGAGIVQFPESLLRSLVDGGKLVPVLPQLTPDPTPLHIIWPSTRHLLPSVRFIIDEFVKLSKGGAFL